MQRLVASRGRNFHRQRSYCHPVLECLEGRIVPSSAPVVDDVPANSYALIALNSAGASTHSGTIDYAGDADLFAFVSSVTGQTTIKVDGGVIPEQTVSVLVTRGQTYAFSVFADGTATGNYQVTITSIPDDFPDTTTNTILLNPDGSGVQNGVIDYSSDVDNFKFTAPVSGMMTLSMSTPAYAGLQSSLTVPGASILFDITPSPGSSPSQDTTNEILQFQVVAGQQYVVQAAGASSSYGNYTLTFAMVTDDFSATAPTSITLNPVSVPPASLTASALEHGSQTGNIETTGDVDLFQFTAGTTGYAIVQLDGTAGTDFHGLLTTTGSPLAVNPDAGFVLVSPFGGSYYFINAAGQATLTTEWNGNTLDPIVILPVVAGETYQIGVSGDGILTGFSTDPTIGKYTLSVDTYSSDAVGDITVTRGSFTPHFQTRYDINIAFLGSSEEPVFSLTYSSVAPEFGGPPGPPPTDARLAVATLPTAVQTTPTTVNVPTLEFANSSLPASSTTSPVLTASITSSPVLTASTTGNTSLPGASLVASLLSVAASDNAVASPSLATSPSSPLVTASTVTPTIQRGFAAPGGSNDGTTVTGTVFDDLNGDGIRQPDEPGLAGETVVLERVKEGKTVTVATITDDSGNYRFADLEPGEYQVSVRRKTGPLGRPTMVLVRNAGPSIPLVVNIGKQNTTGAQLNLEPLDLAVASMPSVGLPREDFPVLPGLNDEVFQTNASQEATSAVNIGYFLLIASGASLSQGRINQKSGEFDYSNKRYFG